MLPEQRIQISLNEDEVWVLIDALNMCINCVDSFATGANVDPNLQAMKQKIVEANETLWNLKEQKTRKQPHSKHNPFNYGGYEPNLIPGEV